MPEKLDPSDAFNVMPTRKERIRVFIGDTMNADERDTAFCNAYEFQDIEQPIHPTTVLIPVASHQDSGHIYTAMREYARQKTTDPFTVFLYLNAPLDLPDDRLDAAVRETERAKEHFPALDIRYATMQYDEPTMGQIRRDLWNAVMVLADHEGAFSAGSPDVIGINNDIDTLTISPHYISRIQQYYGIRQRNASMLGAPEAPMPRTATRLHHGTLPTHPNVGKVTQWVDNTYFQAPGHIGYEAGLVIPFSHYALRGGFREEDKTHETQWSYEKNTHMITGAQIYTSPRRYIDRLAEHGTEGIWLPGSFGPSDACRDVLKTDISSEQAEDLITERLDRDIRGHWLYGALNGLYQEIEHAPMRRIHDPAYVDNLRERGTTLAETQLSKAERFLRCVVKSNVLAEILRDSIDAETFARSQVVSLTNLRSAFDTDLLRHTSLSDR